LLWIIRARLFSLRRKEAFIMAKGINEGLARGLIRWGARVLSIVSTTLLLLLLFGEKFDVSKITATEWLGLAFFPFSVIVGFAVAWWKEGLGGGITIASLLAFYLIYGWLVRGGFLGWWYLVFAFSRIAFHRLGRALSFTTIEYVT
jgi:hypothetical protein